MLDDSTVDEFVRDGFITIRGAVPADVVARCRDDVSEALLVSGVDLDEPTTWTAPVVRIDCPETPAFAAAGTQQVLTDAYDQLVGAGRCWKREGVGGTIPVRFPSEVDPGDAGWHVDGSYEGEGGYWLNVASKGRGLLCLFLLSDVGDRDAPTELKVGSHRDVAAIVDPLGETGAHFGDVSRRLPESTFGRASAFATGRAGDVLVCHPFLVHRATWPHRGTTARIMA